MIRNAIALLGVAAIAMAFSSSARAQCQVTGATTDGGQIVTCSGSNPASFETTPQDDEVIILPGATVGSPSLEEDIIELLDGENLVRVLGGTIQSATDFSDDCISQNEPGVLTVIMEDGLLDCGEGIDNSFGSQLVVRMSGGEIRGGFEGEAISGSGDADFIEISGGLLVSIEGVIQGGGGDDRVIISGGELRQLSDRDEVVALQDNNDFLSVSNAILDGSLAADQMAVQGGPGDDTVRLGDGANIIGVINGDEGLDPPDQDPGNDTLIFAQSLPAQQIATVCEQIERQGGAGQITIKGLDYEWANFESVSCALTIGDTPSISTLDRTGLLLLCLMLGLVGVVTIRRVT